ncbi:MAG: GH13_11, partial [uncultured Gemmatimonadaceae bacterium]
AHRAPLLAGRPRPRPRARVAALRVERRVRLERPLRLRERELHHRPRRLHAARPRELRAEAQRAQRRAEPRRPQQQHQPQLGRRGRVGRPGDQRHAAARGAQLPRHPRVLAGRPDARPRRRDRPHAARQQQRVRAGQRDHLGELGSGAVAAGAARVHAAPLRDPPRQPGAAPPQLLPGAPGGPGRGQGPHLAAQRRRGDDRRRLARAGPRVDRHAHLGRRRRRERRARPAGARRHDAAPAQRVRRAGAVRGAGRARPRELGADGRHRRRRDAGGGARRGRELRRRPVRGGAPPPRRQPAARAARLHPARARGDPAHDFRRPDHRRRRRGGCRGQLLGRRV